MHKNIIRKRDTDVKFNMHIEKLSLYIFKNFAQNEDIYKCHRDIKIKN